MPTLLTATILLAYASLAVELTALHVPSVASSRGILWPDAARVATYSPWYRRIFGLNLISKALLVTPLLAAYGVYSFPLFVLWLGPDPLNDYAFAPARATDAAALVLIVVGRAAALGAAVAIRRDNAQRRESFRLHTAGPFRYCRNPGLVGMYVFVAGLWLACPSATMAAGIFVYVVYMDFKVRMEEDFLRGKFGDAYREYCRTTGRYLP
jgi:protein-S-isoprenylcysteine O-methyltransferase Ste14